MPAVHRLLANVNNAAANAAVAASSVLPATNQVFRQPTTRTGNGGLRLTGGYTGADDATVDVEIRPSAAGAERASTPTFSGAGNGALTDLTVAGGTAAQTVVVTLADLSRSAAASLAVYGHVALRAQTTGTAGNALTLTVTPALTVSATVGALAVNLSRDGAEWSDARLDFSAAALNADGALPSTAPRLIFGGDFSRVYRHYKRWDGTRWQYGLSPAPAHDLPEGAAVQTVTGTYSVAVSNGVTTETYPGVTTLYDLLTALSASALVTVDGVVANDRSPGGQAAIDLPLRTTAWVAAVTPATGLPALAVTCEADAVTDQIRIASAGGGFNAERWDVTSAALGALGSARTGQPFSHEVHFTVPALPAAEAAAPVTLLSTTFAARTDDDPPPPVLVIKKGALGVKASPKTLTLKYTARPDATCKSADYEPSGVVIPALLGLSSDEVQNLDTNLQTRLQDLYQWRSAFIDRNSAIRPTPATVRPHYGGRAQKAGEDDRTAYFLTLAQADSWRRFRESAGWTVLISPLAAAAFTDVIEGWQATHSYAADDKVFAVAPNGNTAYFTTAAGGTSGSSAPAWFAQGGVITDPSTLIRDGAARWRFLDYTNNAAQSTWTASTTYAAGWTVHLTPSIPHHRFFAVSAGVSGATTDPFYHWTPQDVVTDGAVEWARFTPATTTTWAANKTTAQNATLAGGGNYYVAAHAGLTGDVEPAWGLADTLIDGAVTWVRATVYEAITAQLSSQDLAFVDGVLSIFGGALAAIFSDADARTAWDAEWTAAQTDLQILYDIGGPVEQVTYDAGFLERYRARMDNILIDIGISPGKFDAGSQGSAVWHDTGDAFWWEFQDENYLPLFTNQVYHACRRNAAGDPVSTQEWAFALVCACPERLKEGDTARVQVGPGATGYPAGLAWTVEVVGAKPLALSGGVTGLDTLTWSVAGSVDGPLANYALTAGEPAYSAGGLEFTIHRGSIPFALGDQFAFAIETGGRFRWRKDAGSWSSDTAIPTAPLALADGLSAEFISGPAPAFAPGDVHSFLVRQPASPGHVRRADGQTWQWSGASATLTLDFASDQTISAVGLLRHSLSAPATVSLALQNAGGSTLLTVPLTVAPGPLAAFLTPTLTPVRRIVITLANATGMALGWVYAGTPFVPEHNATTCTIRRVYALERGGGVNPCGAYLGGGRGGELAWTDFLTQADLDALLTIVDDCKQHGDEPLVVVPNVAWPLEAALCRISGDEIEVTDRLEFQPQDASRRKLSLKLPLTAVVA